MRGALSLGTHGARVDARLWLARVSAVIPVVSRLRHAASQPLASASRVALPLERLLEVVAGRLELRPASVALAFVLERLVATGATGKLLRVATEVLT